MADAPHDAVCAFVQHAQVAAGAWLPQASRGRASAAFDVLRALPPLRTDRERAAAAYVLARVGERLHAPARCVPWRPSGKHDPVAQLIAMSTQSLVSLPEAARQLGCSKWHLCRLVRARTGLTFTTLIHIARVYRALVLLVDSVSSIKEIAAAVGYRATGELDRQFARWVGCPPSALRRALDQVANPGA